MSAWSGQVRADIQLISWHAFCYSQLHRLTGSNLLTFFLTYLLTCFLTYLLTFFLTYLLTFFLTYLFEILFDISSDILSDISSDILSDISFDILSDISSGILSGISFEILSDISSDPTFFLTYLFTFFLTYLLKYLWTLSPRISCDILSDISLNILSDISSDISFDILSDISPHMIAVEGRRGTLNSQDRGWGPARNTELARSRLRADTEHWRGGGGGGGQGGEGEGHSSPSPDRWGKKLTWENAAIWMSRREIGTPLHPRHPIPLVLAFVVHPSNTDRIFHVILHCLRVVVSPKAERSIYYGWWFQLKWRIWVKHKTLHEQLGKRHVERTT